MAVATAHLGGGELAQLLVGLGPILGRSDWNDQRLGWGRISGSDSGCSVVINPAYRQFG